MLARNGLPAATRLNQPRLPRRQLRAAAKKADSWQDRGDAEDYYSLLGVTKNAGDDEIKAMYRQLQMRYHPDIAGDLSAPMSARLNRAYKTLTNRNKRLEYDAARRRGGLYTADGIASTDGVVGPLQEKAITIADVDMRVGTEEHAVHWLQQWGNSFTFGCETPFQTPLQCDSIARGLQIAFISVSRGQISSQGALQFKVLPNSTSADGQVRVSVSRIAIDPERQLPGEAVVLKTLQNALRSKMRRYTRDQAPRSWTGIVYSALGSLPLLNFFGGQDYDAYHIPQSCDINAKRTGQP